MEQTTQGAVQKVTEEVTEVEVANDTTQQFIFEWKNKQHK
jgi:hypothetical protein